MTDAELVILCQALVQEATSSLEAERLRRGEALDPILTGQLIAVPVTKTLETLRRRESALDERQLAVFLGALVGMMWGQTVVLMEALRSLVGGNSAALKSLQAMVEQAGDPIIGKESTQ